MTDTSDPQWELILCCLRHRLGRPRTSKLNEMLEADIAWPRVLKVARYHGVLPLVFQVLREVWPDELDRKPLVDLQAAYRRNAAETLYDTTELLRVLDLLEQRGIEAVPYKGPVLAAAAYGGTELRQFVDLDIAVRPDEVQMAVEVLQEAGYECDNSLYSPVACAFFRRRYNLLLMREDGKIAIELHWRVAPYYFAPDLPLSPMWDRLETVELEGRQVKSFSNADLMLLLSLHGSKHMWCSLKWSVDIAQLHLAAPDLNWDALLQRAGRIGALRMVLTGLALARDLYEVDLPEAVEERIQEDEAVGELVRDSVVQLRDDGPPSGLVERFACHLRAKERLWDKVRYCLLLLTMPGLGDYRALPLPPVLFPLYYLIRPPRLLAMYSVTLLKESYRLVAARHLEGRRDG